MDEINKRIIEFMVKSGHSKSTFARELEVSLPLITHITSGRNKPGLDLIQKLLVTFKTLNPDWLINGLGEMYREKPKVMDLSMELALINQLNEQISNPIESIETVISYHKLLLDEVLHLQEMDLQLNHSGGKLLEIKRKLEEIKEAIRIKVLD